MSSSPTATSQPDEAPSRAFHHRGRVRIGAIVAIAAAAGIVAWIVIGGSTSNPSATSDTGQGVPLPVSVSGLHTLAEAVPSPIYWVGEMPGVNLELTKTANGRVFIRYLPTGVEIGTNETYLTVATYPLANAYAATERAAAQDGAVPIAAQGGAIAFYNRARPESVYFAEQGSDYQVEVYDPSPARARKLVASRLVQPVVNKAPSQATAVSVSRLRSVAKTLGHPVYWLGKRPGYTYELTQTSDGRVYIRYLPKGVAVGVGTPYTTIATYPLPNALAAVKRAAKESGAEPTKLTHGGLAVVDSGYPNSVHLAYAGSDYQIEVFDPSPARAYEIVTSGEVQQIS
jgi:hypothetical protein